MGRISPTSVPGGVVRRPPAPAPPDPAVAPGFGDLLGALLQAIPPPASGARDGARSARPDSELLATAASDRRSAPDRTADDSRGRSAEASADGDSRSPDGNVARQAGSASERASAGDTRDARESGDQAGVSAPPSAAATPTAPDGAPEGATAQEPAAAPTDGRPGTAATLPADALADLVPNHSGDEPEVKAPDPVAGVKPATTPALAGDLAAVATTGAATDDPAGPAPAPHPSPLAATGLAPAAAPDGAPFGGASRDGGGLSGHGHPGRAPVAAAGRAGAPPRLERPDPSALVDRVVRAAQLSRGNGPARIRLVLQPPELGTLRLTLSVKDSAVSAHVVAETAGARALLSENLGALREALEQQGLQLGAFQVSVSQQGHPGTPFEAPPSGRPSAARARRGDASAAPPAPLALRRPAGRHRIDLVA